MLWTIGGEGRGSCRSLEGRKGEVVGKEQGMRGLDDDVANHGEEGAHASDMRFRLASHRTRNSLARLHEINCSHTKFK